jgi:hypothetical protein
MRFAERKRSAGFSAILGTLGLIGLFGAVYCVLALIGIQSYHHSLAQWELLLYGSWYIACAVSVATVLRWRKWGIYPITAATAIVVVVNLVRGSVTLQAATLGLLVGASLAAYLRPIRRYFR